MDTAQTMSRKNGFIWWQLKYHSHNLFPGLGDMLRRLRKDTWERDIVRMVALHSSIILQYSLNDCCMPGRLLDIQDTMLGTPEPIFSSESFQDGLWSGIPSAPPIWELSGALKEAAWWQIGNSTFWSWQNSLRLCYSKGWKSEHREITMSCIVEDHGW